MWRNIAKSTSAFKVLKAKFSPPVEGKQLYEAYEAKCARLKDVVGRQDALNLELKAKEVLSTAN